MTDVTLNVPDIHCAHCKASIEGAVGELDGVSKVEVRIEDRAVDVTYADPANEATIATAIEDVGYVVS